MCGAARKRGPARRRPRGPAPSAAAELMLREAPSGVTGRGGTAGERRGPTPRSRRHTGFQTLLPATAWGPETQVAGLASSAHPGQGGPLISPARKLALQTPGLRSSLTGAPGKRGPQPSLSTGRNTQTRRALRPDSWVQPLAGVDLAQWLLFSLKTCACFTGPESGHRARTQVPRKHLGPAGAWKLKHACRPTGRAQGSGHTLPIPPAPASKHPTGLLGGRSHLLRACLHTLQPGAQMAHRFSS